MFLNSEVREYPPHIPNMKICSNENLIFCPCTPPLSTPLLRLILAQCTNFHQIELSFSLDTLTGHYSSHIARNTSTLLRTVLGDIVVSWSNHVLIYELLGVSVMKWKIKVVLYLCLSLQFECPLLALRNRVGVGEGERALIFLMFCSKAFCESRNC